jgi:predicted glutamine amidotransferase
MCRLYGLRANEPTKVECTLVHAQNALMLQSRADLSGKSHANGWGLATYEDHEPHVERQAWAAYHGEHFRRAAARVYAETVIAHVRRATVGEVTLANTHPFVWRRWVFAHNGTVPNFDQVSALMRGAMTEEHRGAIRGTTDSEHVFRLLLSILERSSGVSLAGALREATTAVVAWSQRIDPDAPLGLTMLVTDGAHLVGTRWGRSLVVLERHGVRDCEICGFPHVHHDPRHSYRAVVVASEPLTHEEWRALPDRTFFHIGPDLLFETEPLDEDARPLSVTGGVGHDAR